MSVCAIIPAYNAEAFIHKAIESVLNQTTPVEEIIVVDDGSRDGTCAVVESYAPKVRLLRQKNQGPSAARNRAVQESTADYIAFLDADDLWDPKKIERQLHALNATKDSVLCYTGLLQFNPEEGWERPSKPIPPAQVAKQLRLRNPQIVPSSVVVSRENFLRSGGFDTGLKGSEDWDFLIAMQQLGAFCAVGEPLTLYRCSTTGLSADPEWMFLETRKMLDRRLLMGLSGPAKWIWRRRILSYHAYVAAMNARAANRPSRERYWMIQSLTAWPSPAWQPQRFKSMLVTLRNSLFTKAAHPRQNQP
jgi:glycosyltransferase involved in cell wall biosynthesis